MPKILVTFKVNRIFNCSDRNPACSLQRIEYIQVHNTVKVPDSNIGRGVAP